MEKAIGWSSIESWVARSSRFFVKKLSRNDTSWADDPGKRQSGPYVPREIQDSGFFPPLENDNPTKPHIFRACVRVFWPQAGKLTDSRVRHYSNKGREVHFTRLVRPLFKGLSPASWLVGGTLKEPHEGAHYWFVVLDSNSETAEILETALDLDTAFQARTFLPSQLLAGFSLEEAELLALVAELRDVVAREGLAGFLAATRMPDSATIAREAQVEFQAHHGAASLDPFELAAPGDAIMLISRDIEYRIYKRHELRRRAAEIVLALTKHGPDIVSMAVRGFPDLYGIFLSASQQRKTRAGRSFERHVARMLTDGGVRFEEQVVTGGRRPDFVLPSLRDLMPNPTAEALVLSCKTTLKERWKQVTKERFNAPVFLATVDDRVPASAILDMQAYGIVLVVPESLKRSDDTCYPGSGNVISFRDLFCNEIRKARPLLLTRKLEFRLE